MKEFLNIYSPLLFMIIFVFLLLVYDAHSKKKDRLTMTCLIVESAQSTPLCKRLLEAENDHRD